MTWSLDFFTQAALPEDWDRVSLALVSPAWQTGDTSPCLWVADTCLNPS